MICNEIFGTYLTAGTENCKKKIIHLAASKHNILGNDSNNKKKKKNKYKTGS